MERGRYSKAEIESFVHSLLTDGFCVLPEHFDRAKLAAWGEAFAPLLERHIEHEGRVQNRGARRYYVTLPFELPFADPEVFEDEDILAVVKGLMGEDAVMCQFATDTPLFGSDSQDIHRDAPPLFPETGDETPPFQLAVNFPLVDVITDNGPFEVARGTHMMLKEQALRCIESGAVRLEPLLLRIGDVVIRDVRGLHRGTPNRTQTPRPMVVIGYSRRWLFRPEVSIQIPRAVYEKLSDRARFLLRFNPVVDSLDEEGREIYQSFAY
ncbi:MAG: phytanoyl-CoA dioxygenase family protein [Pyrinomonadaceae bacterium]|nr:phytanoyl-CoA dioxygenase family protein [Pyrinomonadaceae bacterium]MBA3569693.1 phytanoyl-CoA dioxygenase family protein [Pyrinomonadaceae bacterium]MBA3761863.1 phytanoyl-CoA dioxygenase family protein [Chthoniobacterales bacterium]